MRRWSATPPCASWVRAAASLRGCRAWALPPPPTAAALAAPAALLCLHHPCGTQHSPKAQNCGRRGQWQALAAVAPHWPGSEWAPASPPAAQARMWATTAAPTRFPTACTRSMARCGCWTRPSARTASWAWVRHFLGSCALVVACRGCTTVAHPTCCCCCLCWSLCWSSLQVLVPALSAAVRLPCCCHPAVAALWRLG